MWPGPERARNIDATASLASWVCVHNVKEPRLAGTNRSRFGQYRLFGFVVNQNGS